MIRLSRESKVAKLQTALFRRGCAGTDAVIAPYRQLSLGVLSGSLNTAASCGIYPGCPHQMQREFSARVRESWRAGVVGSFFRRQSRREAFKYLWPEFPHSQHPQILLSQPRGLFAFGNARIAREHCHPRGKTDSVAISLISNDLRIAWNWQPTCKLQRRFGGRPDREARPATTKRGFLMVECGRRDHQRRTANTSSRQVRGPCCRLSEPVRPAGRIR